jgi:hypothetical protein
MKRFEKLPAVPWRIIISYIDQALLDLIKAGKCDSRELLKYNNQNICIISYAMLNDIKFTAEDLCAYGNMDINRLLMQYDYDIEISDIHMEIAVKHNNLCMTEFTYFRSDRKYDEKLVIYAYEHGYVEIGDFLLEHMLPISKNSTKLFNLLFKNRTIEQIGMLYFKYSGTKNKFSVV